MKCVICRHGETAPEKVTVTLEDDEATIVIKEVPTRVCQTCGEEYIDEGIASRLLHMAEEARQVGIQVAVCPYVTA